MGGTIEGVTPAGLVVAHRHIRDASADAALLDALRKTAGRQRVIVGARRTERFRRGFRSGEGEALAVVQPATLLELWEVLQACVAHHAIVIMQAANTGLTAGSTPDGSYDRPVVIVSTLGLADVRILDPGATQILSFAGGTLDRLERLLQPFGRLPHSVIGSSCLGASVVGGICNNSGGSLVARGPAFTELALYAQLGPSGRLELVNHLGIRLGNSPAEILTRLQDGRFGADDIEAAAGRGSDHDYARIVREVDVASAARFNADPRCLHEASGCAGKLAVFAVRLDTFPKPDAEQVFYIGTNHPEVLTQLRRDLLGLATLPVSAEYMHRDIFDVAQRYGKDTFLVIDRFGTAAMPWFFAMKGRVDTALNRLPGLPRHLTDRLLQGLSRLWPEHLPPRLLAYRQRFAHHLLLKVSDLGIAEAEALLQRRLTGDSGAWFSCTADEGRRAFLHRFAAAGAAIRYALMHERQIGGLVALDIALRRNDPDWVENLAPELDAGIALKLYYGHFLCHVFHQDYIVRKGVAPDAVKAKLLVALEARGAEYPAEHNVGHVYAARPGHLDFFRSLDPTNSFNPGIGGDSKTERAAALP